MESQSAYSRMSCEDLLRDYKETGSDEIRDELICKYMYLVRMVVMRMRGVFSGFAMIDDMINEGVIVLMGAIEKFDYDRGIKFESYASMKIRGAIIDLARKHDWVPRGARARAREIEDAAARLTVELGRHPDDGEIAELLGMDIEKYRRVLSESAAGSLLSLEELLEGAQETSLFRADDDETRPSASLERGELSDKLAEAISELNEKEQLVVSLYYRKELSMKEISRVLSVGESRVSQIHSRALMKMKNTLEKYLKL